MNMLNIRAVTLNVCGKSEPILNDVSAVLKSNRFNLLIGKSGSGKTSLFKCILNLYSDYQGKILFNGKCAKKLKASDKASLLGYVAQGYHLFHHKTVLENCVHPQLKVLKREKKDANLKAKNLLEELEVGHLQDKYPSSLSGGQQQRVAIARALVMDPLFLLLDEPTSALDPENTLKLSQLLKKLKNKGITFLITTHDMSFAKMLLDYVCFMENGEIIETHDVLLPHVNMSEKIQNFYSIQ